MGIKLHSCLAGFGAAALLVLTGLAGEQAEVPPPPVEEAANADWNLDAAVEAPEPAAAPTLPDNLLAPQPPPAEKKPIRTHPKRLRDYNLPGLETKVNFESLKPMDIVPLIEFLAHRGGLDNIVIGREITGLTAKLKFDNVAIADALEVVLSINHLAYEIKGGILAIMTDKEYLSLYGSSFYDHKQVEVVELIYADAARLASILAPVKSAIGTVVSDPLTGTLILIDTPSKISEMKAVIAKADIATVSRVVPTQTRHFVLQYATLEDILKEISSLLTKDIGSVRADKRTRTLIVSDLPHRLEKIDELVEIFDKAPRQVLIEAQILETTLSDDFSMGINWQHVFEGLNPRFSLQSVSSPGRLSSSAATLTYNTIVSGGDLQGVLEAIKAVGEVEILSKPHILVVDGQEASIQVITEQPYKEVAIESGTTNITGVTYLFKEVGVQLKVTPRINDDKFVTLNIKPTTSSISQWYDGAPQEGTPVIRKAFAETTIIVRDGMTVIIGGMIMDRKDKRVVRVPLLGAIPLIGRLFRHDVTSTAKTETIVFLTPHIGSLDAPAEIIRKPGRKQPKPLRQLNDSAE